MKKTATRLRSLCAALAALVLLLALAAPAFAADGFADLYYRMNDSAEVLTEDEDSELEASLEELSVRQSFDVIIATIDSLESEGCTSMEEYADDLYDYCQFGYGENRDGVLLLVSIGDRKWHISTCGYGITAFTDAGIQYLGEQMTPDMADGDYAAAFRTFIQWTDAYVTAARLLGAPPGYLGHDEGGQLTEAVRRRPYSVVLFDEIEKAHPDIQNILLQILEDGQLTDAMGRKADFRNTIVLLTSNLGARFLAGQNAPLGFAAGAEAVFEKQSAQAVEEAKKWFRPELLGRLDEVIVFRPLAEENLCAIAEKMLCQLEQRAARSGYRLRHTPQVGAALAARAQSAYGARELRRQVDRAVEQALANRIAAGTACVGQHWTADCAADGSIVLREDETITL